jgi:hypothetical protein
MTHISPETAAAQVSAMPLADFLAGVNEQGDILTLDERRLIVDQALVLLEQNYVHLPVKVARYGVNPVQRLRLLQARLNRQTDEDIDPETAFHAEMLEIFHSMRDGHTNYMLPAPLGAMVAYLPFRIEEFFEEGDDEARYLVSLLKPGYTPPPESVGFEPGVEVTHWNGVPISRAIDLNAARFAGSNAAARRAQGLSSLTVRPLRHHLPPDEAWVTIAYAEATGEAHELREIWRVTDQPRPLPAPAGFGITETMLGYDQHAEDIAEATKAIFVPEVVVLEHLTNSMPGRQAAAAGYLETQMPGVLRARNVTLLSGRTFGHIRVFTFLIPAPHTVDTFVDEFVRLLGEVSQDGLILDVRANGGGHVRAAERILQTLTPRRIEPEPFQFINTALNLRIGRVYPPWADWLPSMDQAVETAAAFSAAFPLTPPERANNLGQRYLGPVVLVTNAHCYSATDIFAAGFQDHGIGPVLGTDDNTGAGGANVLEQKQFVELFGEIDTDGPYRPLPAGVGMRAAIRRSLRVGAAAAGALLEDVGVLRDRRHRFTRADLLHGNIDLMRAAGGLLATAETRRLDITASTASEALDLHLDTLGIDRVDVYINDRPATSADVADGTTTITLARPADTVTTLRIEGYLDSRFVAARTLGLSRDSTHVGLAGMNDVQNGH